MEKHEVLGRALKKETVPNNSGNKEENQPGIATEMKDFLSSLLWIAHTRLKKNKT